MAFVDLKFVFLCSTSDCPQQDTQLDARMLPGGILTSPRLARAAHTLEVIQTAALDRKGFFFSPKLRLFGRIGTSFVIVCITGHGLFSRNCI